jgi:hypothetical protein
MTDANLIDPTVTVSGADLLEPLTIRRRQGVGNGTGNDGLLLRRFCGGSLPGWQPTEYWERSQTD